MSESDCAICFVEITAETGRSVLGCGHTFHMLCVVRWFSQQDGPSSCPCCRREAGQLDNLPMAEDLDEEAESDEEEDEDDDDMEDIEVVWHRTADGTWIRYWREAHEPLTWKPTTSEPAPAELSAPITTIQALWRAHTVRSEMSAVSALIALKTAVASK